MGCFSRLQKEVITFGRRIQRCWITVFPNRSARQDGDDCDGNEEEEGWTVIPSTNTDDEYCTLLQNLFNVYFNSNLPEVSTNFPQEVNWNSNVGDNGGYQSAVRRLAEDLKRSTAAVTEHSSGNDDEITNQLMVNTAGGDEITSSVSMNQDTDFEIQQTHTSDQGEQSAQLSSMDLRREPHIVQFNQLDHIPNTVTANTDTEQPSTSRGTSQQNATHPMAMDPPVQKEDLKKRNLKAVHKYRSSKKDIKDMGKRIKELENEITSAKQHSQSLEIKMNRSIELLLDLTCKSENEDEMFQKICQLVSSFLKNIKTNTFNENGMESILFQERIMPIIRKRYSRYLRQLEEHFMRELNN